VGNVEGKKVQEEDVGNRARVILYLDIGFHPNIFTLKDYKFSY